MDISALSSAFGAPVETVGQVTGEAGFDAVLEQADSAGFIPPGAPPGPEPPPVAFGAGEEVEVVEPNAQPQKLDFHPTEKDQVDIESQEPFLSPTSKAGASDSADVAKKSPEDADQAMSWLVSQMSGGFFGQPILASDCPTPNADIAMPKGKPDVKSAVDPTCLVGEFPEENGQKTSIAPQSNGSKEPVNGEREKTVKFESNGSRTAPLTQTNNTARSTSMDVAPIAEKEVLDELGFVKTEPVCEFTTDDANPKIESDILINSDLTGEKDKSIFGSRPGSDPKPVGDPIPPQGAITGERPKSKRKGEGQKESAFEAVNPKLKEPTSHLSAFSRKGNLAADVAEPTTLDLEADVAVEGKPNSAFDGQRSSMNKSDKGFGSIVGEANKSDLITYKFEESELEVNDKANVTHAAITSNVLNIEAKPPSLTSEESELVLKQVEDKLHLLAAARPRNGVTIHLNPDDLGSITVVIKSVGRMVDTQITASDPRVSEALDQNRTRLIEAMDSRGFQLQAVTVTQNSGHSTQQDTNRGWQQSNQQSQSQSQSGQSHSHRGQSDRHLDQPKSNIRAWARRSEGVDLAI